MLIIIGSVLIILLILIICSVLAAAAREIEPQSAPGLNVTANVMRSGVEMSTFECKKCNAS